MSRDHPFWANFIHYSSATMTNVTACHSQGRGSGRYGCARNRLTGRPGGKIGGCQRESQKLGSWRDHVDCIGHVRPIGRVERRGLFAGGTQRRRPASITARRKGRLFRSASLRVGKPQLGPETSSPNRQRTWPAIRRPWPGHPRLAHAGEGKTTEKTQKRLLAERALGSFA